MPNPFEEDRKPARTPDLLSLLESAKRYWWACAVLGALTAAAGFVASRFLPLQYRATALVRLGAPNGLIERPYESSTAQRAFRHTQKEILLMNHVIGRALASPEVAALQGLGLDIGDADDVADGLEIVLPRSSEIMSISFSHDDAEAAYVVTNAVLRSYFDEITSSNEIESSSRLEVLEDLQNQAETRLTDAWSRLQSLAREIGSGDPATLSLQTQAEVENYRAYSAHLREVRSEMRDTLRVIRSIRTSPELLAEEIPEDASMHSVKYAMFSAKLAKEEAKLKWGDNHPDVKAAEHKESLLREYYQKASQLTEEEPKSEVEKLMAEPLATLSRLEEEENSLINLLEEIDQRLQAIGGDKAAELEIIRNDVDRLEKQNDRLWQAKESLEIESRADPRVQLVSWANRPENLDSSKRDKIMIVLVGGGCLFGIGLVSLSEFFTGRLHSFRDAVMRTAIDPVATGQPLPKRVRRDQQLSDLHARELLDRSFARLANSTSVGASQVILVASSKSEREVGYLSEQLAQAAARTGQDTLHIDLSRDPASEQSPGSGPLAEEKAVKEAVAWEPDVSVPNLSNVDLRDPSTDRIRYLTSDRFKALIASAKQDFRFVFVKVPPVLSCPETLYVAKLADLGLLGICLNSTTSTSIVNAAQSLQEVGLNTSTVILK